MKVKKNNYIKVLKVMIKNMKSIKLWNPLYLVLQNIKSLILIIWIKYYQSKWTDLIKIVNKIYKI